MKDISAALARLWRISRQLDMPAQPSRGTTARRLPRAHATRSPWSARPETERRRIRKAAHEARRRNRA